MTVMPHFVNERLIPDPARALSFKAAGPAGRLLALIPRRV
jgi:hypothetical protein